MKEIILQLETEGAEVTVFDCGHLRIRKGRRCVDWWPISKKRTVYDLDSGETHRKCDAGDVIRILENTVERKSNPRGPGRAVRTNWRNEKAPRRTNPSCRTDFYSGEIPPWDESLGDWNDDPRA